jgi:hypothetical protein
MNNKKELSRIIGRIKQSEKGFLHGYIKNDKVFLHPKEDDNGNVIEWLVKEAIVYDVNDVKEYDKK